MDIKDLTNKVKIAAESRTDEERYQLLIEAKILDEDGYFVREYFSEDTVKRDRGGGEIKMVTLDNTLQELLESGVEITMKWDADTQTVRYDLNVNYKSGIVLAMSGDKIIAHCRYEQKDTIQGMEDLLDIHRSWHLDAERRWNKGQPMALEPSWEKLYIKHGLLKTKEEVIPEKVNRIYDWS